jgi:pyruvate/2-oxoglutarate/acetoin dehydrogenase E1 component
MTLSYLQSLNKVISDQVNQMENTLVYGENLDRGSFISGLSKNLIAGPTRLVKNIGNCEYTHCGVGFGLMMSGHNAVLFVKQLDFMMLGIDHFVSTYGQICATKYQKPLGSFTIVTAVYDQGFQGPQSSFRGLNEICSMSGASGFLLQENADAKKVVAEEMSKPGFRFIALSQRMANDEVSETEIISASPDNSVIQFAQGNDATVVCFGYSLVHGKSLVSEIRDLGRTASLFTVNYVRDANWGIAIKAASASQKLVVIDDTRGATSLAFRFLADVLEFDKNVVFTIVRSRENLLTTVSDEKFEFKSETVIAQVFG